MWTFVNLWIWGLESSSLFIPSLTMISFPSWNVSVHLCVPCGLYPRGWYPDLTFCTCPKESLSAGFFSLTQAKGLSGDSNRSLRNAWSFSLCPEVGVGQENSISVFSLMLQPRTSPDHSLKKRCVPNRLVLRLPRAGLLWPQRSLGEAEGKRPTGDSA